MDKIEILKSIPGVYLVLLSCMAILLNFLLSSFVISEIVSKFLLSLDLVLVLSQKPIPIIVYLSIYSSLIFFSSILSYVFLGLGNYYDHFLIFYTKIKNTILYIFFYKILLEFFLFSKYTKH
uniref:Uncharacterized protein n=1 Tax=Cacopsylla melanoneura TaxID=428564 RepID=A0A8D8SCZ6_9HEMI